jgi:hypothetical protein
MRVFLRFVTAEIHRNSGVEAGVFVAAYDLYYGDRLPAYEAQRLRDILDWFNLYLKEPRRFSRSTRRSRPGCAVCWFRPTAREHLARAHEMAAILEENGLFIRRIKAPKVGYVVYEDEHQVVAEPVADMIF